MKRVCGGDAAFLYGETPTWHMHVSAVLVVDPVTAPGGWDFTRFVEKTASRLHLAPQFRWRLVEIPFGLDRPMFVEDPDFDVWAHIRRIGLPSPGGPEQLGNLIGDLVSIKLDRRKALWEFWVIDNLADGKLAILAKIHHSIIDGVSGSELASVLMDLEADPEPVPPPDTERAVEVVPNPFELLARGAAHTFATPLRTAASMVAWTSTSSRCNSSEPASIEARSRMSLMMTRSAAEERMMWSAYSRCRSLRAPTVSSPRSWVKPMMLVSGERSS